MTRWCLSQLNTPQSPFQGSAAPQTSSVRDEPMLISAITVRSASLPSKTICSMIGNLLQIDTHRLPSRLRFQFFGRGAECAWWGGKRLVPSRHAFPSVSICQQGLG